MSKENSEFPRAGRVSVARTGAVGVAAFALIFSASVPAHATYTDKGMPTSSFNYKTTGINDTWVSIYDTGNIRWNQHSRARLGRSTTSASTATAGAYSESWYGLYEPARTRPERTFRIRLNSRTLDARYSSRLVAAAQVGATHELGHALSLAHIGPRNANESIMDYADIDDLRVQLPQAYDRTEVERIY